MHFLPSALALKPCAHHTFHQKGVCTWSLELGFKIINNFSSVYTCSLCQSVCVYTVPQAKAFITTGEEFVWTLTSHCVHHMASILHFNIHAVVAMDTKPQQPPALLQYVHSHQTFNDVHLDIACGFSSSLQAIRFVPLVCDIT